MRTLKSFLGVWAMTLIVVGFALTVVVLAASLLVLSTPPKEVVYMLIRFTVVGSFSFSLVFHVKDLIGDFVEKIDDWRRE